MIKIVAKYADLFRFEHQKIQILRNPTNIYGLQFLMHTRLLIFKNTGGHFTIDFDRQNVVSDKIYIVPPFHFCHIKNHSFSDFFCVDIHNSMLTPYHKQLIYFLKYDRDKSVTLSEKSKINFGGQFLLELPDTNTYNEQKIFDALVGSIEDCFPIKLIQKWKGINYAYIYEAENFLSLLSQKHLTIESCKIQRLAVEMFVTERNLQRICNRAFGVSTKDVVKYHLTIKALYLLCEPGNSINDIAKELEFSSLAVFTRYIKRVTGYSPSEIREILRNTCV